MPTNFRFVDKFAVHGFSAGTNPILRGLTNSQPIYFGSIHPLYGGSIFDSIFKVAKGAFKKVLHPILKSGTNVLHKLSKSVISHAIDGLSDIVDKGVSKVLPKDLAQPISGMIKSGKEGLKNLSEKTVEGIQTKLIDSIDSHMASGIGQKSTIQAIDNSKKYSQYYYDDMKKERAKYLDKLPEYDPLYEYHKAKDGDISSLQRQPGSGGLVSLPFKRGGLVNLPFSGRGFTQIHQPDPRADIHPVRMTLSSGGKVLKGRGRGRPKSSKKIVRKSRRISSKLTKESIADQISKLLKS